MRRADQQVVVAVPVDVAELDRVPKPSGSASGSKVAPGQVTVTSASVSVPGWRGPSRTETVSDDSE